MYRQKIEKQMSNIKSMKTPMLPEPSDDNKSSLSLPQVSATSWLTPDKSTLTSGNKHLWHQLLRSSDAMMIHLVPTDYVHETSSGTLSAMDSKPTTRRKPTWEMLLPL
jgi:enterochelin esterase-like enzyme